jgi:hypothetical protein
MDGESFDFALTHLALAEEATATAFASSIRAGEALLESQARMSKLEWEKWMAEKVSVPLQTASTYMRLARVRASLPADIDTIEKAGAYLARRVRQSTDWLDAVEAAAAGEMTEDGLTDLAVELACRGLEDAD